MTQSDWRTPIKEKHKEFIAHNTDLSTISLTVEGVAIDSNRLHDSKAALCRLHICGDRLGALLSPFRYDLVNIDSSLDIKSEITCELK